FNIGPVKFNLFTGSTGNNQKNGGNPYITTGAINYFGANLIPVPVGGPLTPTAFTGAAVGFDSPAAAIGLTDDNESGARIAADLFKIAGQPVSLGYTKL